MRVESFVATGVHTNNGLNGLYARGFQRETLGIVGSYSGGMSKFFDVLTGTTAITKGTLYFNTQHEKKQQGRVVRIYGDLSLIDDLTVAENIFIGSSIWKKMRNINWKMLNFRAFELIRAFDHNISPYVKVGSLKANEKVFVALMKAMQASPDIIILDNITVGYSARELKRFNSLLCKVKRNGTTVIFTSSDINQVISISDRILVIKDGKKAADFSAPDFNEKLLKSILLSGSPTTEKYNIKTRYDIGDDDIIFRISDLTYKNVQGLNIYVRRGETVGLMCKNIESEKLFTDILFGEYPADNGIMQIGNTEYDLSGKNHGLFRKIGFFNGENIESHLFANLTVKENFILPLLDKCISNGTIRFKYEQFLFNEYQNVLGITRNDWDSPITNIDNETKVKIILCRLIAAGYKSIIFYEPFAKSDLVSQHSIKDLIFRANKSGIGCMLCSCVKSKLFTDTCDFILDLSD